MSFLKEHLTGIYYKWSTNIPQKESMNGPDSRPFDRFNGNQISYLINSFGQSIDKLTIEDGQRIESLIMKELPSELKSEIAVFNWIKGRYYITVIKKEQRP